MVGELLEGLVDLRFELGEGGRVSRQLLGPKFLLLGQGGLDLLEGLLQRRNLFTGFGANTEFHGYAQTSSPSLISFANLSGRGFLGTTFWACTPG